MAISNTHRYSVVRKFLFCFTLLFLLGSQMAYSEEASDISRLQSRLLDILQKKSVVSDEDIKKEMGVNRPKAFTVEQHPDLELTMKTSVEQLIAGEPWSIVATMSNHSEFPVWIVDTKTTLLVPSELSGRSNTGSIGAFFPTIKSRSGDEIIRIEPNSSYAFRYSVIDDNKSKTEDEAEEEKWGNIVKHITNVVRNFTFFSPGIYEIPSVVHVWVVPPEIEQGKVKNYGDTITITSSINKSVESSPWVLIMGASIGGVLCFVLGKFYQNGADRRVPAQPRNSVVNNSNIAHLPLNPIMDKLEKHPITHFLISKSIAMMKRYIHVVVQLAIKGLNITAQFIFKGILPSILLTGVGTILLSRLSTTNFLIAVKITDVWGAVVVGFMLQWGGYTLLSKMMTQAMAKIDNKQVDS